MAIAPALAVLGTASDVGKSVITTGLCRIFQQRGFRPAPFKAQNMSNNAGVTPDGLEIGRAQLVQAEAARAVPHPDMNPILLKPNTDTGAQVVLHGRAVGNQEAGSYFRDTATYRAESVAALERLRRRYGSVVIEGAGSCAEVNLRRNDFVNFDMAHACDAPVVIVADIDRGGVFAQILGTMDVLPAKDRERVAGFIINRFRGDASLFEDGLTYLRGRLSVPLLGVVPWCYDFEIDAEDAIALPKRKGPKTPLDHDKVRIAVIRLPHIANFTDFAAPAREPEIDLRYLANPRALDDYHLVLLPGSKNVRFDLDWLKRTGWAAPILDFSAAGGMIGGICGGYQMLGRSVSDPHGVEGAPGTSDGLGLLPVRTQLARDKHLSLSHGRCRLTGQMVRGYEIHMGRTVLDDDGEPLLDLTSGDQAQHGDGAMIEDGRIWGTYLHGLFDEPAFLAALLRRFKPDFTPTQQLSAFAFRQQQYDLLADHLAQHLDLDALFQFGGLSSLS
ncbi:cobyric acid synthase [Acanthopleuribacter pedis]|uniref:Cobyric acid synthase n=1 Tax=Acanthopleuribacter pedis TaxID=442870 RepID=A0A8J7Q374_9BACT|nr:cobyric acid synthase [Acanthopleuribacter pedis]MBO1318420.1 cobyric acid synthase [Acanthopleuribacter pedis]